MSLLATTYDEYTTRRGRLILLLISAVWCGIHGVPKVLCKSSSYHISTTEPSEQQEKPGNKYPDFETKGCQKTFCFMDTLDDHRKLRKAVHALPGDSHAV